MGGKTARRAYIFYAGLTISYQKGK